MESCFLLSLFFLSSCFVVDAGIKWRDCFDDFNENGSERLVSFLEVHIKEYPLRWGVKNLVSVVLNVSSTVDADIMSVTSFGPMMGRPGKRRRGVALPCLNGNFGSCSRNLCTLFLEEDSVCRFIQGNNASGDCDCPLKAGLYAGDSIDLDVPSLPGILRFLASVSPLSLFPLLVLNVPILRIQREYFGDWMWFDVQTRRIRGCIQATLSFVP